MHNRKRVPLLPKTDVWSKFVEVA